MPLSLPTAPSPDSATALPHDAPLAQALTYRNLPLLLLQTRESVFARFRPLLNAVGLTEQQWRIIRALLDQGPLEPRQIADICCLASASLAGILARMDECGWVLRERFPKDQRRVLVRVSPQAQTIAAELAPQIQTVYTELESQLGPALFQDLYRTLDRCVEKLGASTLQIEE